MARARPFLLFFGVVTPCAGATVAMCQSDWEWSFNSYGNNPCEIAGFLDAECQGFGAYAVGPLEQGTHYITPQRYTSAQGCECNTVMYSLYMACTACQNVSTQPWSFWVQNCDSVYVSEYPGNIPLHTAVPNWAYVNVTGGGGFDPAIARHAGHRPERICSGPLIIRTATLGKKWPDLKKLKTAAPSTSSVKPCNVTGSERSTSIISTSLSTTNSAQNSQAQKPSKVNSIVGGLFGGLAFLATASIGIWMFLRIRRKFTGSINESRLDYTRYPGGLGISGGTVLPSTI